MKSSSLYSSIGDSLNCYIVELIWAFEKVLLFAGVVLVVNSFAFILGHQPPVMFKILFALFSLCLIQPKVYAQDAADVQAASIPDANCTSVDALADYIKQHFKTDTDRVRAIYVWTTHHIAYDIARLQALQKDLNSPPQAVADVLTTRSAVCQGYADLFVALCKGAGINAVVIGGYTKIGGKVSAIPHAWVATMVAGQWALFDPTWGAGYVKENTFVKDFNNSFYKAPPARFISDHMPFDPMNQLLAYPLTNKEFIEGKPAAATILFHYADSLNQYAQLSYVQQTAAELRRLEAAGVQNDLLLKRQQFLKNVLQSYSAQDVFEESGNAFNNAVALYNKYIVHKNNQFTTIGDNDLRAMVDSMAYYIKRSRSLLIEAVPKNNEQRQAKSGNMRNMEQLWAQLDKEKLFTEQYFAADTKQRKQLFMSR